MKIEQSLVAPESALPAKMQAYDGLPAEESQVDTDKGQWAPYIYFHSQKSEKAPIVMQRYPHAAEGDAFLMADQDILFLRPGWMFSIVLAKEYQIMRDSSGALIEAKALAKGARPDEDFKEEITAVTLVYSEDTGIVPTVTQWRTTKCGAVRSALVQQKISLTPGWVDNPGINKEEKRRRAEIAGGFKRDWMRVWSVFDPGKQKTSKAGNPYRIAASRSQSAPNDVVLLLASDQASAVVENIKTCIDQYHRAIDRLQLDKAPVTATVTPAQPAPASAAPVADKSLDDIPF